MSLNPSTHRDAAGRFRTDQEGYVGVLVRSSEEDPAAPSHYCLEDGNRYRGAPYRVGGIPMSAEDVPDSAIGEVVLVYGARTKGLDNILVADGPCPPEDDGPVPQMRSDWVADEAGLGGRTTRARLAETDFIQAVAVYPLPLVAAKSGPNDTIALTLRNLFDVPWPASASFSLYYEGGGGKPMPSFVDQEVSLEPGASYTVSVERGPDIGKPGAGRTVFMGYRLGGSFGEISLSAREVVR